jgi:hypothetical protein
MDTYQLAHHEHTLIVWKFLWRSIAYYNQPTLNPALFKPVKSEPNFESFRPLSTMETEFPSANNQDYDRVDRLAESKNIPSWLLET